MDFPDSHVQKLVKSLKKRLRDNQSIDLASFLEDLSSSQRFHFYCLVKNLELPISEHFTLENKIWNQFQALFRNDYENLTLLIQHFDSTLDLAGAALLNGLFELEDFRTLTRYLFTNATDYDDAILKINISILHFLNAKGVESQILVKLRVFLRFLGIPLAYIENLKITLLELFPKAQAEINSFLEYPISTCQKHPEYVEEIAEQLNYDVEIPTLKDWLNGEILSRLARAKLNNFIESWVPKKELTVDELISDLKEELKNRNLTSLPVVYHSFIKPFSANIQPKKIKSTDIEPNIPQEILKSYIEKKAYSHFVHKDSEIQIFFLGGEQIGTMGILICTPSSNVLIDFGLSVMNYQIPFWHEALNHLDAILITHAHLDHIGGIPYLYGLGYNGFIFGSIMTKNLTNFLLIDNVELMKRNISEEIRTRDHRFKFLSVTKYIHQMLESFITIEPGKTIQITPDVTIKPYLAHHIQGSYAYLVECGDKEVLFSGDVNLDPTILFGGKAPKLPYDADLTIVDSTYYGQPGFDPEKRDELLISTVKEDERVIIPAFSIGRAQEVMVTLEKAGLTRERKISMLGMATKVARVSGLKTKGYLSNYLVKPFDDEIVISGGGMLGGGYARELVEQTKDDPDTTIVLCGFLAKNTLGNRLLRGLEPEYKQKIVYTRFSGHSSNNNLMSYLNKIKGIKALVHIGDLSTDPINYEETRKKGIYNRSKYHIPSLGSSLTL
jgi:Cft2 family RNA processing exonuclease